ncbi:MAG: dihydropteroate synthase [Planctomycetes bacterium]|nr:dihydropteroate synthase [Planctomycetota bacterium]
MTDQTLICGSKTIDLAKPPVIMGILNVTPDSFSDVGRSLQLDIAVEYALDMVRSGAAIIDVGGESTRPGSQPVPPDEQIKRTVPVIEKILKETDIPISIDTTNSTVAEAAIDAGAVIINDISALRNDPQMADLAARQHAAVILMHMQGNPAAMQKKPTYTNVLKEVIAFLAKRIKFALDAGISPNSLVIDPGIGFGKTVDHNLMLIREISQFHHLKTPLMVGLSKKSFIGKILDLDQPADRLIGSIAAHAWCIAGNVHILRVHDVAETIQAAKIIRAIGAAQWKGTK